jgi:WD40 repeat protein
VGEADPILTIDGFAEGMEVGSLCDVAIAPDEKTGVMKLSNAIQDYFYQVDLDTGSWEEMPHQPGGKYSFNYYFLIGWSPNGRWLLFESGFDTYFWDFFQQREPSEKPIPVTDYLYSVNWTGDSEWLVYQDGKAIYAVSPLDDQSPIKIFDLPGLPEDTSVSLWVE